jgi:hypothetical protein
MDNTPIVNLEFVTGKALEKLRLDCVEFLSGHHVHLVPVIRAVDNHSIADIENPSTVGREYLSLHHGL